MNDSSETIFNVLTWLRKHVPFHSLVFVSLPSALNRCELVH